MISHKRKWKGGNEVAGQGWQDPTVVGGPSFPPGQQEECRGKLAQEAAIGKGGEEQSHRRFSRRKLKAESGKHSPNRMTWNSSSDLRISALGESGPSSTWRAEACSPILEAGYTEDISQYWFFWELKHEREHEEQLELWGIIRAIILAVIERAGF